MNLFEATKRGQITLKKLLHALIAIKPKSVEPEGFFSHVSICHKTKKQTAFDRQASVL